MSLKHIFLASAASLGIASTAALADTWQLDSDSSVLNFVSVKNDHVDETHRFTDIQGSWADNEVTIEIPVTSLDTQIPIRNERMLKHLFNAEDYSIVSATANLEEKLLTDMPVSDSLQLMVDITVFIAGKSETIQSALQVTRLGSDRFLATTTQPINIDAKAFGLVAGIDQLREIAGLQRIDYNVPVTFSVQFTR
ncbi:YceI family protein [Pseudidiomarina woesei]|uniref:Polyisoprenoid-binding periplasmic protein YceI n=1 Tax=Pseudidiomarina woesei TaxID=1381080 RepID=A0A0K6H2T2_9GAMM|nr:YceI family protein [Pseudidiomarina woesei]CUA85195.1 Polyisoprenoid-binding periplasmic protein YceI [Pseudidiomarina woesei]